MMNREVSRVALRLVETPKETVLRMEKHLLVMGRRETGIEMRERPIPYRSLVVDGKKGKYSCVVTVPEDYQDGRFTVCLLGSLDESMPAEIVDATINGEQCALKDGSIVGVSLKKDKKYKISYTIALKGMYASEVIFHANR
jgi:hypothetical protein